jgi:MFS family permease
VTLIQQVVPDNWRGQIFAVLGSLVMTFTLIGTLAAGPITEAIGPRLMWGISATLLVIGFFNVVLISAWRRSRESRTSDPPLDIPTVEAGGEIPASSLERMSTLLDEVAAAREREAKSGIRLRPRRIPTRPGKPPPPS